MIVRAIDPDGDWLFGKGRNDYFTDNNAIAQLLATRLRCFLGNCFFDQAAGPDWFNLLGSKNQLVLNLEIKSVILNTTNVIELVELLVDLDQNRKITLQYKVKTVFPGFLRGGIGFLLDELGNFLTTEDGDKIHA